MDNKEKNIELIKANLDKNGYELYNQAKKEGYGIRKQTFYELYRNIHELPEPSIETKERTTPIKYRLPSDLKFPTKEGKYGIAEIKDTNDNSYFIKYTSRKDFKQQFATLSENYPLENATVIFHGFKKYTSFIAVEFKENLEKEFGVSI